MREIESVVIAGNIARDNIFGKELVGGCAYNIASTLSQLGIKTGILSAVDNSDFGAHALIKLAAIGVDVSLVQTCLQQMPQCTVWGGDNNFGSSEWIDNGTYETMRRLSIKGLSTLQGSLIHMASCPRTLTEAILLLMGHISYEPGPLVYRTADEFSLNIARRSRFVFFNKAEWDIVTTGKSFDNPSQIMGENSEAVIITDGEKGSIIHTRNSGIRKVEAVKPNKIIDFTGAGDQYKAGFLAARLGGKSLEESAYIGSILASRVLGVIGGQLPNEVIEEVKTEYFREI
jgi:sugar/nucleoside kinase (ribokinase family)